MTTGPTRTVLFMRHLLFALALVSGLAPRASQAQTTDDLVLEAREALKKRDRVRLDVLRTATTFARHPLAQWVDYWELGNRLNEVQVGEVEAFYARWPGSYVEDRLRNDWLLELGKRRDWAAFARDMPRFRMNDDREVTCYQLLTQHQAGQDVAASARATWTAQRDADDGCNLLASTLYQAGRFKADDVWYAVRVATEFGRPRAAKAAAGILGAASAQAVADAFDNPAKLLANKAANPELALLAVMRLAAADPAAAVEQLQQTWQRRLGPARAPLAWAVTARQAAFRLLPEAAAHYKTAWRLLPDGADAGWSDDVLAWQVRAALRSDGADRWAAVLQATAAMSAAEQKEASWVYWRARALQARARPDAEGEADRAASRAMLESIAGQISFYGKLATEDLGGRVALPAAPLALTAAERQAARATPGLVRALQLIALGLRNEGVREWNFTLRGLADRELLAAAQLACESEVWDRCINTSDRTRVEVDMAQRFPMPFRREVLARAASIGLDPAYMYGLIRQESRFIMDARSSVGASGLMQIMPATAKWTAKKIGLEYRAEMITDRDINLQLGASYLKIVLDDFGGSQALAAAAYNAGPGRPRRWREGGVFETAAWAESIPFNETRDYVKKVLSNAVYYAALLTGQVPTLKSRLGGPIGPRDPGAPNSDREIP
jgi:soluble lytic murein transglycosylase